MCLDVRPNEDHRRQWAVAPYVHKAIQAAPDMSEHDANTHAVLFANQSIQHSEGGWPKEVDASDVEHVLRYRKKVPTTSTSTHAEATFDARPKKTNTLCGRWRASVPRWRTF